MRTTMKLLLVLGFLWSYQVLAVQGEECDGVIVNCLVAPCSVSTLPCKEFYPNAVCEDNYCNGCHAIWRNGKGGKIIKCDPCAFPRCKQGDMVQCFVDPCQFAAKPDCGRKSKKARCISNFCGGCNAVWVDKKGKQLPQKCNCIDCFMKITVTWKKRTCTDCTCQDIRNMGKKYAKKVCKKYKRVKNKCCATCRWAKS